MEGLLVGGPTRRDSFYDSFNSFNSFNSFKPKNLAAGRASYKNLKFLGLCGKGCWPRCFSNLNGSVI